MRVFSTFTGVGGFELGIKKIFPDAEFVGMSEIETNSNMILKYRFPEVRNYGDISKIRTREIKDFDLLCGGFPCQPFSMAGKRRGFNDTRGTLFYELARIIKDKKPKYFLFENVEGLLSHEEGRTFAVILKTLDELGYDAEWQLLYSKHYGIPQNRPRVYIFGCKRGEFIGAIFPIRAETEGNLIVVQKPDEKFQQTANVYNSKGIMPTLTKSAAENTMIGDLERTITIHEAERLQGFPDDWTEFGIDADGNQVTISMRERFARMGNAVTVNVVAKVMERIKDMEEYFGE